MSEDNKHTRSYDDHLTEITETSRYTVAKDGSYHLFMDTRTGVTVKWGFTPKDDPAYSPWGPEIADIEVSTICGGIPDKNGKCEKCSFCYKQSSKPGTYMRFETFKEIFDRLNMQGTLTQIAFGSDATAKSNPDMWEMFKYCRDNSVVPNITVANVDDDTADKLVKYCGAVAVSWYPLRNKEVCYDTVRRLKAAAFRANRKLQLNIHALLAKETLQHFDELISDCANDPRLEGLNAVVLLSLKQKGGGVGFHSVCQCDFNTLIDKFRQSSVQFGMDSCSANKLMSYIDDNKELSGWRKMIEPCESTLFSSYINVHGQFFPCSFMEGEGEWVDGIDVCSYADFKDVWLHPRTVKWRNQYLNQIKEDGCTHCPYYNL